MKALSLLISTLLCGLVLFRPQVQSRFLARPDLGLSLNCPPDASCCLPSALEPPYLGYHQQIMPLVKSSGVYGENIKGTTVYVLRATGWSERDARRKLLRAFAKIRRESPVELREIDGPTPQRTRWPVFAGLVGLILMGWRKRRSAERV